MCGKDLVEMKEYRSGFAPEDIGMADVCYANGLPHGTLASILASDYVRGMHLLAYPLPILAARSHAATLACRDGVFFKKPPCMTRVRTRESKKKKEERRMSDKHNDRSRNCGNNNMADCEERRWLRGGIWGIDGGTMDMV